MSGGWSGRSATSRGEELPEDWKELRETQLMRDGYRCVWILPSGARCEQPATDVDHYGAKWDHSKLRSLCGPHHDKRTARQGMAAARARWAVPPRRRRGDERPY